MLCCLNFFFFLQAEDGIRDYKVTGVQTCALPIYSLVSGAKPSCWSADSTLEANAIKRLPVKPTHNTRGRLGLGNTPRPLALMVNRGKRQSCSRRQVSIGSAMASRSTLPLSAIHHK